MSEQGCQRGRVQKVRPEKGDVFRQGFPVPVDKIVRHHAVDIMGQQLPDDMRAYVACAPHDQYF